MEQPEEVKRPEPEKPAPPAAPAGPENPQGSKMAAAAVLGIAAAVAAPTQKSPDPLELAQIQIGYLQSKLQNAENDLARMAQLEAERDEWRLRYERAGAEANRLRPLVEALERERRESLTESRLKERDALRSEAAGLSRKVTSLEKDLAEARSKVEKLLSNIKGMSHEIERTRETTRIMQQARDMAYKDRDLARAALREAEERGEALAGQLRQEREARAEERKAREETDKARKPAPKEAVKK